MKPTKHEQQLMSIAYIQGYERGHNDTVESCYTDSEESAKDWLEDPSIEDGIDYLLSQLKQNKNTQPQASTKPCSACHASGIINYHASAATCDKCNGKGRIRLRQ